HGIIKPSQEIIDASGLEEAYFIKRIRYANNQPLAIENQYYPVQIGTELANYDIEKGTLYDLLEQKLHIKLSEAEQIITSSHLSKKDAELLGLEESVNVLNTERLLYDQAGKLIEYYKGSFRSDMYSFRIKLSKKLM